MDLWCKLSCNPHDRNELHGVSVCVSCVHLYKDIIWLFFWEGGGGLTCDCEGNRLNGNNRSMWLL